MLNYFQIPVFLSYYSALSFVQNEHYQTVLKMQWGCYREYVTKYRKSLQLIMKH